MSFFKVISCLIGKFFREVNFVFIVIRFFKFVSLEKFFGEKFWIGFFVSIKFERWCKLCYVLFLIVLILYLWVKEILIMYFC